jgi:rod shape-determining protein MreC
MASRSVGKGDRESPLRHESEVKRTFSTRRLSASSIMFVVLASVSVVLLVLSSTGRMAPVEGAVSAVARPFLTVFNDIGRQVDNVASTVRDLSTLRSENRRLSATVDTLTIDNARLAEVQTENQQLRELLRFRQLNPFYDFRGGQVIARVISRGPTNYLSALSIDLGSDQGIAEGMPVVTERGLVGRIQKVGPTTSTVLLITDPASGVQAMIKRENSRAIGVVDGQAGTLPVMDYIAQEADVAVGDEVETSGLGGNFPKGLTIGQIVEVKKKDFDMYQQGVVRPTVDFNRLEFVLVITNFKPLPGQPPEMESVG